MSFFKFHFKNNYITFIKKRIFIMKEIKGIFAASMSILDENLTLNSSKTILHAENLIDQGCHGVAIFGSTGQAQLIPIGEKVNLLNKLSVSKYKNKYLIGTGLNSLGETINLMNISTSLGFNKFLIMPPAYYKYKDKEVVNFYSKIIDKIPESKIILYNFEKLCGYKFSINCVEELVKKFPDLVILSDEVYDRLIFDNKEIPTLLNYPDLYDRLIILNGWSKTYAMTGWRLGWGVWPENLVEYVFKFCVNNHSCVNTAAQYGAIAALEGPEDHLNNMMKEFIIRRKLIVDGLRSLKGVECSLPGGSFFAFPNVKETGMNGEEFAERCLQEAGVAIIPGTAFGKFAKDNVRFNFATSQDNISQALEKINNMLG